MERTKVAEAKEPIKDGRLRWRKIGGGSLRLPDRIIKPNQTFRAFIEEIPKAFRDTIICLDTDLLPKAEELAEAALAPKVLYGVKKDVSGKGWNVINMTSEKPINDAPLATKKEAEELKTALEG